MIGNSFTWIIAVSSSLYPMTNPAWASLLRYKFQYEFYFMENTLNQIRNFLKNFIPLCINYHTIPYLSFIIIAYRVNSKQVMTPLLQHHQAFWRFSVGTQYGIIIPLLFLIRYKIKLIQCQEWVTSIWVVNHSDTIDTVKTIHIIALISLHYLIVWNCWRHMFLK